MSAKVSIEVDPQHEAFLRQALAMREEMEQLALLAADGAVLDVCEEAVIDRGRKLSQKMLSDAAACRIEAAEKKGRRSGNAHVVGRRKTKGQSFGG